LVAGSFHYKLADPSKLLIFKQAQAVPGALDGVVAIVSHKTPIIVATAAGAAAVITTVALVRRRGAPLTAVRFVLRSARPSQI
jgi:hypothetical protein